MNIEFKLPELGEHIDSGDVVNVLVEEGEPIVANQGVCELETDKAVVEIPCPQSGRIVKVHIHKGDTVHVGQTLITLDTGSDGKTSVAETLPVEEAAPGRRRGETETGRRGDTETTGAAAAGQPVSPGGHAGGGAGPLAKPVPAIEPDYGGAPVPAGPATRRLARQLGVDLRRLHGSGPNGRITPEDVQAAFTAARAPQAPEPAAGAAPPAGGGPVISLEPVVPPGEPAQDAWGRIRREKMSKIRRTIAAQMSKSAGTIPHVTNFDDADVTELEQIRAGIPKGFVGAGIKLTAMPFVMKAVAIALRRHPQLNASLDETQEQVIYKEYVHLGVAVDTPRGLVVPVVRNVDRMSIGELARALALLAERARGVQFGVEDLRGGTFTISNMGAVGGAYSTPIINHPEVAVLLLGRTRRRPEVRDGGRIEPRQMLPLSLSYDHRLVDGAAAARFLNEVIDHLQNPGRLLLAD
jgi:pyruvate/2-oxoglutarate dehydrogenase complex dihydrolipoamide acyltransferase (E2) component